MSISSLRLVDPAGMVKDADSILWERFTLLYPQFNLACSSIYLYNVTTIFLQFPEKLLK